MIVMVCRDMHLSGVLRIMGYHGIKSYQSFRKTVSYDVGHCFIYGSVCDAVGFSSCFILSGSFADLQNVI